MRIAALSITSLLVLSVVVLSGCSDPCANLKGLNATQQEKIATLEGKINAAQLELTQCTEQLNAARSRGDISAGSLQQQVAALEAAIKDKNSLIDNLQRQLLKGGVALPPELTATLRDWAAANPNVVSFDETSGVVKFKTDVLFEKGSDTVSPDAVEAVKSLATIMNSENAKDFDVLVAGHTDDIPISKPETRAKHKDNWYLSAHRGVSVAELLISSGLAPERTSVRAFGEFRPLEPNGPNKQGNKINRRVEIFIIGHGA
jgi:chemotaxis protein MotB